MSNANMTDAVVTLKDAFALIDNRKALIRRVAELEECLAFFADANNYDWTYRPFPNNPASHQTARVLYEGVERARTILRREK